MSPQLRAELANAIDTAVQAALGHRARVLTAAPVGGAMSINWQVMTNVGPLFVKTDDDAGDRFAAEADGLQALARCAALRVPAVLATGEAAGTDFLILEWLDLTPNGDDAALGAAVADLHRHTAGAFGWPRSNYLGRTPQDNTAHADWGDFFLERRLQPQLARTRHGWPALATAFQPLTEPLRTRLRDTHPRPALLHGDLWRGNVGFVAGQPALFDPACHFGDGACDLAMADLFGGFSARFFAAYRQVHADPGPDAALRQAVYQLYHVLNHVNLFGGSYISQARQLIGLLASLLGLHRYPKLT